MRGASRGVCRVVQGCGEGGESARWVEQRCDAREHDGPQCTGLVRSGARGGGWGVCAAARTVLTRTSLSNIALGLLSVISTNLSAYCSCVFVSSPSHTSPKPPAEGRGGRTVRDEGVVCVWGGVRRRRGPRLRAGYTAGTRREKERGSSIPRRTFAELVDELVGGVLDQQFLHLVRVVDGAVYALIPPRARAQRPQLPHGKAPVHRESMGSDSKKKRR